MMTVRVQAALMRFGYFNGDIAGIRGPQTRAAITSYQKAQGLPQTGRMDIDTLMRLGISIP
jgi:peptidoglycan hydrolase-like protein with peptidoglycan-binding domain